MTGIIRCEKCGVITIPVYSNHKCNNMQTKLKQFDEEVEEWEKEIGELIGEATMCWKDGVSGIFDGDRACVILDKINAIVSSTIKSSIEEERNRIERHVGMMRQWLNEDRIDDPNKMVTNEELFSWFRLGRIINKEVE